MVEFILLFRRDYQSAELQPSAKQVENFLRPWQNWFSELVTGGKLVRPIRLDATGRAVFQNEMVTCGPYIELKESIGGIVVINAENYDDAVAIVKCCPILQLGINVEIRMATDL